VAMNYLELIFLYWSSTHTFMCVGIVSIYIVVTSSFICCNWPIALVGLLIHLFVYPRRLVLASDALLIH
jgi:hypothetical protein